MVFSFVPFGTDENLGLAIAVTLLSMPWYGMAVGMDRQETEKGVVGPADPCQTPRNESLSVQVRTQTSRQA